MGPRKGNVASHRGVGRGGDYDEAPDHVRVVGGELHCHCTAEVVPDDARTGQAEVGAEGVEEPAAVAHPVP